VKLPSRWSALLAAGTLALTGTAANAQWSGELVEPLPVEIPAGVSAASVDTSIKAALYARDWKVVAERPGYVEAELVVRSHMARVGISYDARSVSLKYLASAGMGHRTAKGRTYIYTKYNGWTSTLMTDIAKFIDIEPRSVTEPKVPAAGR
jgi:hypothetical protein